MNAAFSSKFSGEFIQPHVCVYKRLCTPPRLTQTRTMTLFFSLQHAFDNCTVGVQHFCRRAFDNDWALPRRLTPSGAGWLIEPALITAEPPCSPRHTCWCMHLIPAKRKVDDNVSLATLFLALMMLRLRSVNSHWKLKSPAIILCNCTSHKDSNILHSCHIQLFINHFLTPGLSKWKLNLNRSREESCFCY